MPATIALATWPDTLAPATALAVVANDTAPVTLAPGIPNRLAAFPLKKLAVAKLPKEAFLLLLPWPLFLII